MRKRGCLPNVPGFAGEGIFVFYNRGNACEGELQIGHVYAADIDILAKHETVVGIVELILLAESFQSRDKHSARAAGRIVDCYDFIVPLFLTHDRLIYTYFRAKAGNVIRRKKLSVVFVAHIRLHKQFTEPVVKSTVVIDDGSEKRVNFSECLSH